MKSLSNSHLQRVAALSTAVFLLGLSASCTYKQTGDTPAPCNISATVSYQADVWPILKTDCRDACHNPATAASYANFNMDDFSQVYHYATTNPTGFPSSYLLGNIRHESGYVWMPSGGQKLDDCEIATIEAWVNAGAKNN